MKGREGLMAIILYMSKTYDWVEWGVLGGDDVKNGIPKKVDISNDDVHDYGLLLGVNQWGA